MDGVHQAMEYLPLANNVAAEIAEREASAGERRRSEIDAFGKHVVIIGGGDTGTDCYGTALRQGAKSVHQFDIMPKPPEERAESTPWPTFPLQMRLASAHEEGDYELTGEEPAELVEALGLDQRERGPLGKRAWQINTVELTGDGKVESLKGAECRFGENGLENIEGTEFEMPADLVLLAMGFVSVETDGIVGDLDLEVDGRGRICRNESFRAQAGADSDLPEVPVFVAGDAGRGQSLIVWGISEGRSVAAEVDRALMGETALPRPINPTDLAMRA